MLDDFTLELFLRDRWVRGGSGIQKRTLYCALHKPRFWCAPTGSDNVSRGSLRLPRTIPAETTISGSCERSYVILGRIVGKPVTDGPDTPAAFASRYWFDANPIVHGFTKLLFASEVALWLSVRTRAPARIEFVPIRRRQRGRTVHTTS